MASMFDAPKCVKIQMFGKVKRDSENRRPILFSFAQSKGILHVYITSGEGEDKLLIFMFSDIF